MTLVPRCALTYSFSAFIFVVFLFPQMAAAATLTFVSDTISTSEPSVPADHTIRFTTTNAVPAGGVLIIRFQSGQFTIPSALTLQDIDLSIQGIDRPLASNPSGSTVGVTIVTGTSGSITLNFANGVAAHSTFVLPIGTVATSEAQGTHSITNPSSIGSYYISIHSEDGSAQPIDDAKAMIAVVDAVTVGQGTDAPPSTPPTSTNGTPPATGNSGSPAPSGAPSNPNPNPNPKPNPNPNPNLDVCRKADVNCDGKVNLVDFSIEAFWYKKPNPIKIVDLNGDGMVTLVDFSIMAFYWTG